MTLETRQVHLSRAAPEGEAWLRVQILGSSMGVQGWGFLRARNIGRHLSLGGP